MPSPKKTGDKKKIPPFIIEWIIMASSVLITLVFSLTTLGRIIDYRLYDTLFNLKPRIPEWNKIAMVNIDNRSLDLAGRWPWPRNKLAEGIAVMKEFGVQSIILDIEFPEPQQDTLNYGLYQDITNNSKVTLGQVAEQLFLKPDRILFDAINDRTNNVYLACRSANDTDKKRTSLEDDENREMQYIAPQFFLPLSDSRLSNYFPASPFLEFPVFPLFRAASALGFVNVPKDIDGTVRRVPLFWINQGYLIPQLMLPVLMDNLGLDRTNFTYNAGGSVTFYKTNGERAMTVPLDSKGNFLLNWSQKWTRSFTNHYSYSTLLEYPLLKQMVIDQQPYLNDPSVSAENKEIISNNIAVFLQVSNDLEGLRGKIAITGLTAESSTDIGSTTLESMTYLVIVQATALNTLFQGQFLRPQPLWVSILVLLAVVILTYIVGLRFKGAMQEFALSIAILLVLVIGTYAVFVITGIVLNYTLLYLGSFLTLLGFIIFKFVTYDSEKNYIKKAFTQYLSAEVVKQLIDDPSFLQLGGESRQITAYFSDVEGFTKISESLGSPEKLVNLLNEYLTVMTDIIMDNGGYVDKYEGDAIVAMFGAPVPQTDHAIRCCNAAVDMQKALMPLREKWMKDFGHEINARMGMNTGLASIGNMGSRQKTNYTMMGDTVNLASRLEGANKPYGTYTMISDSTFRALDGRFICRKLDKLRVIGKTEPISVFELCGRAGELAKEKLDILAHFEQAYAAYDARDWLKAYELFSALARDTGDRPSKTYAERCMQFKESPPSKDWDGVFVLKSK